MVSVKEEITRIELGGRSTQIGLTATSLVFFSMIALFLFLDGGIPLALMAVVIASPFFGFFVQRSIISFGQTVELSSNEIALSKKDIRLWTLPWKQLSRSVQRRHSLELTDNTGNFYLINILNLGARERGILLNSFPAGAILESEKVELCVHKFKLSRPTANAFIVLGTALGICAIYLLISTLPTMRGDQDAGTEGVAMTQFWVLFALLASSMFSVAIGIAHVVPKRAILDDSDYPAHRLDRFLSASDKSLAPGGNLRWSLAYPDNSRKANIFACAVGAVFWSLLGSLLFIVPVKDSTISQRLIVLGMVGSVVSMHLFFAWTSWKEVDPSGWSISTSEGMIKGTAPSGEEVEMYYKLKKLRFRWRGNKRMLDPKKFYLD